MCFLFTKYVDSAHINQFLSTSSPIFTLFSSCFWFHTEILVGETITFRNFMSTSRRAPAPSEESSVCGDMACSQEIFEQALREHAFELGIDLDVEPQFRWIAEVSDGMCAMRHL
jgi:hypothetical protein